VGLAVMLAGCGFHLQGHSPLPRQFKLSYVDANDRQSDFVQGLRNALLVAGVELTDDTKTATATVHVLDDKHSQRVLSVSPDNLPREYELTYTVRFSVTAGDKELLAAQEVSTTREYSFTVSELLAKENEEAILQAALAHDLVDVVMRRLSTL
jgi:LPS-assembly lipoprotein